MNNIKFKIKNIHFLMVTLAIVGFASCRNYKELAKAPAADTKGLVRDLNENATDTSSLANIPWRIYFPDTKLQVLVGQALETNYSMQVALSRIKQSEAALSIAGNYMLPTLSAVAQVNHTRISNGKNGTDVLGYSVSSNQNSLGLALSWEADLWGKLNSQTKAKFASYLNTLEYKKLVQTTLIANIARSYYTLLALDEQLKTTKESIALLKKTTETMQALKDAGQQTQAAVEQSKALLYSTQLSVFDLESRIRQQENAICVLLGRKPGAIDRSLMTEMKIPETMNGNISVRNLSNRPDVRQAELSVQSALALTDAARAAFYPSLNISSLSLGLVVGDFSNFFSPKNIAGNLVAGLTQPIFFRGQLKGNLKIAQAQQEEALLNFSGTVLNAGQEISDVLFSYKSSVGKNEWRAKQVDALTKSVDYTQELLKAGEANYTEVLNAEQSLLSAQLNKVNDKLEQLNLSVSLYKALGGGVK